MITSGNVYNLVIEAFLNSKGYYRQKCLIDGEVEYVYPQTDLPEDLPRSHLNKLFTSVVVFKKIFKKLVEYQHGRGIYPKWQTVHTDPGFLEAFQQKGIDILRVLFTDLYQELLINHQRGEEAENLTIKILESYGYTCKKATFKQDLLGIDLIASKGSKQYTVQVKSFEVVEGVTPDNLHLTFSGSSSNVHKVSKVQLFVILQRSTINKVNYYHSCYIIPVSQIKGQINCDLKNSKYELWMKTPFKNASNQLLKINELSGECPLNLN